jgi:hypothetical protein
VWIVRVNINNYTSILHEIKANGCNVKGTEGMGKIFTYFAVAKEIYILKSLSKQEANLEVQNSASNTPLLKAVRE